MAARRLSDRKLLAELAWQTDILRRLEAAAARGALRPDSPAIINTRRRIEQLTAAMKATSPR